MRKLLEKKNLFLRVLIGFIVGMLLGVVLPEFSIATKVVGDLYLNLIRLMIIPIVAMSVFCGIVNIKDSTLLKRIGFRTVLLYVIMFIASSIVSLCVAFAMRPGLGATFESAPAYSGDITSPTVSSFLMNVVPTNIFEAAATSNTLAIILFMIVLAIAVLSIGKSGEVLIEVGNSLTEALFKMLSFFMELSPLGVMSLMAFSIAQYGVGVIGVLAKYILTCWLACIAVFIIVMIIPTCVYTKISPKKLLTACGKVALVSLSTTSSAATLPTTMNVSVDDLKAPKGISQFTLSLGSTINMCGGAASFCCLAVFVSDFYNLSLGLPTLVFIILTATLLNMSAPGIPGGGIVLGASFLSLVGLPFDLMGPISGFYRLLDMAFTTLNVQGDLIANLLVAKNVGEWDVKNMN